MRPARIVLIVLILLAGLAVAGDRIALMYAETEASDEIKREYGLQKDPDVDIKGFPFLTQVLDKQFQRVDVDLSGIEAPVAGGTGGSSLRISTAKAELRDLKVSGSNWDRATAGSAEGRVRITYEDISAALPSGLVKVSYGGKNAAGKDQFKATVGADFLGRRYERSATGTISIENGDTVRLQTNRIEGVGGIPGLEDYLREQIDFEWRIEDLPKGIELADVQVTKEGVEITGGGENVELSKVPSAN